MNLMKTLVNIFTIILTTATLVMATTTPDAAAVEFSGTDNTELFTSATFDLENETLAFTTTSDIQTIQLYSAEGELTFTLPVNSNIVNINKNLLDKGTCKLGFQFEGQTAIDFIEVQVR